MAKDQDDFAIDSKIGSRLREQRSLLGLNQSDFAALGGVSLGTQHRYESGSALPATEYLLRIGSAGADWVFIMTGERSIDSLSPDETEIVDAVRQLDLMQRHALSTMLEAFTNPGVISTAALHDPKARFMPKPPPDGDGNGSGTDGLSSST
jgi:transcriptional regulator with XRE-family HTH domain